jgi:hypothetical protein
MKNRNNEPGIEKIVHFPTIVANTPLSQKPFWNNPLKLEQRQHHDVQ